MIEGREREDVTRKEKGNTWVRCDKEESNWEEGRDWDDRENVLCLAGRANDKEIAEHGM